MQFQLDDIKQLRLGADELDGYRLLPGDLLICEGGEPGRCAIWRDPDRQRRDRDHLDLVLLRR